jgi:soluble lytic murein transglycosylase-like protein
MERVRGVVARLVSLGTLIVVAGAPYVVAAGDTLSGIAWSHGTTVGALADENGLSDPDHIQAGQRLTLPGDAAATPAEVAGIITRVARRYGWSPAFVKALAWQESGWNQQVVSSAGAVGVMQVMPGTGRFVSRSLVGRELDLADPEDNVLAGVAFLQYLWELTDGDVESTLAGYYQGLRSERENGRYPDTDRYIANVLALRDRFR